MRTFKIACLVTLATAHQVDSHGECDSMLQLNNPPHRAMLQEDCSKGGCKPGIVVGQPPSNRSVCQGHLEDTEDPESCLKDICEDGTILDFTDGTVVVNNLGGMGPDFGKEKMLKWTQVGKVRGRNIDLVVTTPNDEYYNDNYHLEEYHDKYGFRWPSGQEFIHKHNGAHFGAGTIGSMAPEGNWSFHFQFLWTDNQKPATVPVLPLTFYDIDGGRETTTTCDAHTAIVHRKSELKGDCIGGCCIHEGLLEEIEEPTTWDSWLTEEQLKASVTYVMRDKDQFVMHYATSFSHRIFFFKGSKVLACEWE